MRRKSCKISKSSMVSLPDDVMTEIMFRLPIKSIIMCKCTCKALRDLISSNDFVNLHYARAKPCILLANHVGYEYVSRFMYLIEPSNMNGMSCISDDYCVCYVDDPSKGVNMKLDTKLELPVYDDKIVGDNGDYVIVNACNGFLCFHRGPQTYIVCNPFTNEYIKVPSPINYDGWTDVSRGFGFCPKTKQYKVVRWLESMDRKIPVIAEIHTLKVHKRWRTLVDTPHTINFRSIEPPMYANGFIFWVYRDSPRSYCVLSFDLEVERFRSLPKPPIDSRYTEIRMEMIGDRPSLCARPSQFKIDIWIIDDFGGVSEHWSKYASIDIINKIIIYESKRQKWRSFKIYQNKLEVKTTVYTPSFFSLKDAVPGANVKSIDWFRIAWKEEVSSFQEEVQYQIFISTLWCH
ncbi:hypothetical protein CASFOL_015379 [Castilleja foliolosa]|uniref:F-box domain-containing protein n=1 Tax=Castilleja foliolosa TaxID=1961234 RepID=A0ABD3DFJ9_9LAMI